MAADPAQQIKTNQYLILFMGVVLLFGALRAVFETADEYDPSIIVWMNLTIDLVMTLCLVVLLGQVGNRAEASGLKSAALALGGIGIVSGVIKLIARISSDHGWWTGHYSYAL